MRQLVVYGGTTYPSDAGNTSSANVERDPNGDIFVSGTVEGTIPAAAPTSAVFHSLAGALLLGADVQTGAVTLTSANKCIQNLNAAGGAFTATLPAAASSANLFYWFLKIDSSANVPTLKGAGSDVITTPSGSANTYTALTAQGSHIALWCNGTQWFQLG